MECRDVFFLIVCLGKVNKRKCLSTLIKISIWIRLQGLKYLSTLFRVFSFQEIYRNFTLPEFTTNISNDHVYAYLVWAKNILQERNTF